MEIINKETMLINECRLCKSKNLRKMFDFGSVPLGNNLQSSPNLSQNAKSFDLLIMNCISCNHFQLNTSVSPKLLYATNYTYLSGIGLSFVKHIKTYVNWVVDKTKLKKNSVVIDVGSNDGTCLECFQSKGYTVCGIDPARKPAEIANQNGIFTINKFFNKGVVDEIIKKYDKVDVVTSQNVLAHINNLDSVFKNIYQVLREEGYFVFEIGYFKRVLESGCFDTIYHEHIDYHHANPLVKFLINLGFDVLEISENNIQGGSLRFLLQKTGDGVIKSQPGQFLSNEKNTILYNNKKLNFWYDEVETKMKKLREVFLKYKSKYDISYAYGAPTKATLLLKMLKLDNNDISFVVDDNKLKVNRFMPLTNIPIKSSDEIEFDKSAVIILFAWNFADDIIKKIKEQYKVEATIILPLPNLKVIKI
jgi:SAM-dependent methyltransferase